MNWHLFTLEHIKTQTTSGKEALGDLVVCGRNGPETSLPEELIRLLLKLLRQQRSLSKQK